MSSEITAENAHLYQANCGVVNTATGAVREGVTDKRGKLAYHNPLPWWKRLFGITPTVSLWGEPEYVATGTGTRTYLDYAIWRGARTIKTSVTFVVYRETHLYTGARRYWTRTSDGEVCYIDTAAYEHTGKVVRV